MHVKKRKVGLSRPWSFQLHVSASTMVITKNVHTSASYFDPTSIVDLSKESH